MARFKKYRKRFSRYAGNFKRRFKRMRRPRVRHLIPKNIRLAGFRIPIILVGLVAAYFLVPQVKQFVNKLLRK